MEAETLIKAISEARHFIEVAEMVTIINDKYSNGKSWIRVRDCTKETATCKRASMDLSRALSDLRQGR